METKPSKFVLKSKGCVGGIISVIFTLLTLLGVQVAPEESAVATLQIEQIIAAVAGLYAVYGRVVAKERVHFFKPETEGADQ